MTNPTQAQQDLSRMILKHFQTYWTGDCGCHGIKHDLESISAILADHVAEEVAKATAWQPINTAPKDGTMLLLHDTSLSFEEDLHTVMGYFDEYRWATWNTDDYAPTHWKPLDENLSDKRIESAMSDCLWRIEETEQEGSDSLKFIIADEKTKLSALMFIRDNFGSLGTPTEQEG